MFKKSMFTGLLLILAVLFAQVGTVAAAPSAQETTPITGTIQDVQTETDTNEVTTVLVTLVDDQNVTQTVRISLETAVGLGLIQTDPVTGQPLLDPVTGEPLIVEGLAGQSLEIDPATVIPDEGTGEEEPVHPISALLAAFFGEDGSVIDGYHEDGFGFGVIAQAMWMSQNLNGDASLASDILLAKETGDFSAFVLPDGSSPANWGQFRKAVLEKKNNLGVIVSGHADPLEDGEETLLNSGNGNGNGHGNGNGNGNGHGNGPGNGNGHGHGHDE